MITAADLEAINKALENGADARIQHTPDGGYRILSDTVKVIKKLTGDRKTKGKKDTLSE